MRVFDAARFLYGPHPGFQYHSKAFDTWVLLRGSPLLAAKELVQTHLQLVIQQLASDARDDEKEDMDFSIRSRGWGHRLTDLFQRDSYLSRELRAATVVMVAQQLSGKISDSVVMTVTI